MDIQKNVKAFAFTVFTLLGVLFGAIIMTFIFAQLGPEATGLEVNDTGYDQTVAIQNNSLNAIVTYTEQSDTQFLTIAIAVTLVILIGLFALFWRFFVAGKDKEGSKSEGNFM